MSRLLAVLALILLALPPFASAAEEAAPKPGQRFYAVVFGVTFAANGDVKTLRLLKVVDPRAGNADAPNVKIPDEFTAAVGKMLATPRYRPRPENVKPDEVYTYFFFDPARPNRADLDPRPRN